MILNIISLGFLFDLLILEDISYKNVSKASTTLGYDRRNWINHSNSLNNKRLGIEWQRLILSPDQSRFCQRSFKFKPEAIANKTEH